MNYILELKVPFGSILYAAAKFLENGKKEWRATLKILKDDYIIFKIEAKDITALRAIFNQLSRLLVAYEKLNKILG